MPPDEQEFHQHVHPSADSVDPQFSPLCSVMSALGHKQTSALHKDMSALPSKAIHDRRDASAVDTHVRFTLESGRSRHARNIFSAMSG